MSIRLDERFLTVPLAHRALHDVRDGRPENSRAAIRAAITHGYGIEIDLQLSSDGQAMVFHDYQLDRLTGETGAVAQRTAAALADIVLTGGDEGVPTFAEVLTLVDGRVPLLVEIKDQDGALGRDVGPLEVAAAAAVQGYSGYKNSLKTQVRIVELNAAHERDLAEFIEAVTDMPPAPGVSLQPEFTHPDKPGMDDVLVTPVREGAQDDWSRFEGASAAIGHFIRMVHEGRMTKDEGWEGICGYNAAMLRPQWPVERLKRESERLWERHVEKYGIRVPPNKGM